MLIRHLVSASMTKNIVREFDTLSRRDGAVRTAA